MKFKLPRRPKGRMTEPNYGSGWHRAHMVDQPPGQPVRRKAKP